MSKYPNVPNKVLAQQIVNLWEQANENSQAQEQADDSALPILMRNEIRLYVTISILALELAKKVIEDKS